MHSRTILLVSLFLFYLIAFPLYGELDLHALSLREDLWPKEVVMLSTITYQNGKKFSIGTKIPLLKINSDYLVIGIKNDSYLLDHKYTDLSLLVDESALLQSPTSSLTSSQKTNPQATLEGPDFSFLLNTKIELAEAERTKAIELLLSQGGYLKAATQLQETLLKGYESGDSTSAAWIDRLYFSRICSLLGQNESELVRGIEREKDSPFPSRGASPLYQRFKPETLRFFLSSPAALTKSLLVLKPEDNIIGFFSILESLFQNFPHEITQYPTLAGAFAIVYDQAIPERWPHRQVAHDLIPLLKERPWITLFDYFQKRDQESALAVKLNEMSVSELKYVVDCPIEISELNWALKAERQGRANFDKAYFDVEYDEARIKGNITQYNWPYEIEYRLKNIKEKKGICIDQSYFSAISAKAFGIPSISISGQGANCAHAWLGFMPSNDRWNMKGGRYEANNYVVGFAWDPQTWKEINDHELEYISQHYTDTPEYLQSQNLLIFLSLDENALTSEQTIKILQEAKTLCPKNPEPWFKLEKHAKTHALTEELKRLYPEMIEQFSLQKDWKTHAQEEFAKLAASDGNSTSASEANAKMINENKGKRSDLAIQIATRESLQKLERGEYDEAFQLYQSIIKKFGKENGLSILLKLVEPFVAISISKEQPELVQKSMKAAEKLIDESERQASLNQTKQYLDGLKKEIEDARH